MQFGFPPAPQVEIRSVTQTRSPFFHLLSILNYGQELATRLPPKEAKREKGMKTRVPLALVLVLVVALSGCAKGVSPAPATTETAMPTATAISTEVPARAATSVPAVWDLAKTMLNQCTDVFGVIDPKKPPANNPFVRVNYGQADVDVQSDITIWYVEESTQRVLKGNHTPPALSDFPGTSSVYHPATDYGFPEAVDEYAFKVISRIISQHPEFLQLNSEGTRTWQGAPAGEASANDGKNNNPWSYLDYNYPNLNNDYEPRRCPSAVLFIQSLPANEGGDGTLVGDAYLFYEVGGTIPFQLDGQLKEVHFAFQPAPK